MSFALLWLGDKVNREGVAVTRYLATLYAPLAGLLYPDGDSAARQQITVLLYDDAFLKQAGSPWPMPGYDHAEWLSRVFPPDAPSNTKPQAIFLDILFKHSIKDDSIGALTDLLCAWHRSGIRVYLAGYPDAESQTLTLRKEMLPYARQGSNAETGCFSLVGIRATNDPVDRQAWAYPLTSAYRSATDIHFLQSSQAAPANNDTSDTAALGPTLTYRNAATVLAQDAGIALPLEKDTPSQMALVWGNSAKPLGNDSMLRCRQDDAGWWLLIPDILRQFVQAPITPDATLCPFHRTVSMRQAAMSDDHDEDSTTDTDDKRFKNRIVLVGTNIQGLHDVAYSPVHRALPGVYAHAMALDNLMTYGAQYKLSLTWGWPPSSELVVLGLIVISVFFLMHQLFALLMRALRNHAWSRRHLRLLLMDENERLQAALPLRLANAVCRMALVLIRLTAQTFLGMLIMLCLQWGALPFRVGMLPIVELVTMTILAECLQFLDKIHRFLGLQTTSPKEPS